MYCTTADCRPSWPDICLAVGVLALWSIDWLAVEKKIQNSIGVVRYYFYFYYHYFYVFSQRLRTCTHQAFFSSSAGLVSTSFFFFFSEQQCLVKCLHLSRQGQTLAYEMVKKKIVMKTEQRVRYTLLVSIHDLLYSLVVWPSCCLFAFVNTFKVFKV